MSPDPWPLLDAVEASVGRWRNGTKARLLVVGICGAQGSGKSTLAAGLTERLQRRGVATALLSLDDLYLTREEREVLARDVHPLLRTRGVPGTHDVRLGHQILDALEAGAAVALPRFDKGSDDRSPPASWPIAPAGVELLILEGWCVGARPQTEAALSRPLNALEREEDANTAWRSFVNRALAGEYRQLFGRIHRLIFLAAPSWDVVRQWRTEQEQALRRSGPAAAAMTDEAIGRFVQHYERLTRQLLADMPARADLVAQLAEDRTLVGLRVN